MRVEKEITGIREYWLTGSANERILAMADGSMVLELLAEYQNGAAANSDVAAKEYVVLQPPISVPEKGRTAMFMVLQIASEITVEGRQVATSISEVKHPIHLKYLGKKVFGLEHEPLLDEETGGQHG